MTYKNTIVESEFLKRKSDKDTDIRGDYFRDQTAIIHSRPFRRLKNKTQVFYAPKDDHVCTRIEHVLHVATIAGTICRGLNKKNIYVLDIDLAFAIGLAHDIGHAPFGHKGEKAISDYFWKKIEHPFKHEIHGYRVVEYLANGGKGLNLTYAVKDGIISHNGEKFERAIKPSAELKDLDKLYKLGHYANTYEGCIVRQSDKIAYLGRDIEDALILGFVNEKEIPQEIKPIIGLKNGEIINNLILDLIENSEEGKIQFSEEKAKIMEILYKFNTENIYNHERLNKYTEYCYKIIFQLCEYLENLFSELEFDIPAYDKKDLNIDKLFGRYLKTMNTFYEKERTNNKFTCEKLKTRIIVDYISGMTDIYALECMREISIPKPIGYLFNK